MNDMHPYDQIQNEIKYKTGRQEITCPSCRKPAAAYVAGLKYDSVSRRKARRVKTTCKHCHTSYTFVWRQKF